MGLRQKSAEGIFWSAAQSWGARAISFFIILALARLVKPEAFGLVAYATVFISLAQIFVDQGFSDAIVQCTNLEREHLDTAFWISLLTGILLTGIGIGASQVIAQLFHEPDLAPIIGFLSISFVLSALSGVQQALLRRQLAFKVLALRSFIVTVISGLVAVGLAFLGWGVWSLVAKMLVASFINIIALWTVTDWRPSFHVSMSHFKQLFSFGINIVASNFVDFFSLHGDDFLIGYYLGPIALGYYTLAYNLLIVMTDFVISVPNAVLFPAFSRLQSDIERLKQSFFEVSRLQSIISFPIFLGISVTASEIVVILYGQEWAPSIPVIQILMLLGISRSITYFHSSIIRATGKPAWRLYIWTLTAVVDVIGFFIVVRRGIVAVASVYVLISFLVLPLYFVIIRKLIKVSIGPHLLQYVPAFISSLVMVIFVIVFKNILPESVNLYLRVVIYIFGGALFYLFTLLLIQPQLFKQMKEFAYLLLPKYAAKKA
jgi:O-antigen/teichoic acid export membrane protein